MFPIIIITCGSPQREEIFFRKILGGIYNKLNFIKQNYTDFEEERLREKRKNVCFHHYITGGPTTQREEVLYEKEKFLNFSVCVCVFVCVCVCLCVCNVFQQV